MKPPDEARLPLVHEWLDKAEEDFAVAEHLAAQGVLYPQTVGFHAQQAAEKFLKAFLTWHQVDFPKIHDIDRLLDLVASADPVLAEILHGAIALTDYAVDARYPGVPGPPTKEDAAQAVELARQVRTAILAALKDVV